MERTNINWFPGHMAKAIRVMKEKLSLVDLIIEVRDARAVLSSTNPIIQELFKNKPRIIILNKQDLADDVITTSWIKYFKQDALIEILATNLLKDRPKQALIKMINNLLKEKIIKKQARGIANWQVKVMIIGIPNVGKSRLINTLVQRKASNVANQPGVTKGLQWVKLAKNIHLLDTPGILWPKLEQETVALHLSLIGAVKEQLLPFNDISYYALNFLFLYYPKILKENYDITLNVSLPMSNEAMNEYFLTMSKKYGFKGTDDDKILQMMTNFYFAFKNGVIKNLSWERPT